MEMIILRTMILF